MSRTSFSLSSNPYGFPDFTSLRDRSETGATQTDIEASSINASSPPSPTLAPLSESFSASSRCLPGSIPPEIANSNFRHSLMNSPTRHTSAVRSSRSAESGSHQVKNTASPAYPSTNGNAGGKLPIGNATSRIPARSFSAAAR